MEGNALFPGQSRRKKSGLSRRDAEDRGKCFSLCLGVSAGEKNQLLRSSDSPSLVAEDEV